MRILSKVLVLIAVLCAVGLTFYRVQTCHFVGVSPGAVGASSNAAVVTNTSAEQAGSSLIYPSAAAAQLLHLGYEVFTNHADGSMMALPLPPGVALNTTVELHTAGHHRLSFLPPSAKCGAGIDVQVYRPDRATPLWHGMVTGNGAENVFDISATDKTPLLLVSLKMADGAANNWFCNITLRWDAAS